MLQDPVHAVLVRVKAVHPAVCAGDGCVTSDGHGALEQRDRRPHNGGGTRKVSEAVVSIQGAREDVSLGRLVLDEPQAAASQLSMTHC